MIHPVLVNPAISPLVGALDPVAWHAGAPGLALMWRDISNAKPLRYITYNGKYLVVKNV